jgi:hypothetical protein
MFERLSWLKRLQASLAIAFVIFVIVLGVLALRTAMGKDPSLGTARSTQVLSTSSASGVSSDDDDSSSDDDDDDEYDDPSGESRFDDGSSSSESSSTVAPMTTSQS